MTDTPSSVDSLVRRYCSTVADLGSTEQQLLAVLSADFRAVEHPNPVTPDGAVRDLDATLRGFRAGKALLQHQTIDVHEVLVAEDRAAVRATWRGVVGARTGSHHAGQVLTAETAHFFTIRDGVITHQVSYDCFR